MRRAFAVMLWPLLSSWGCVHTTPDAMGAAEHRREADAHRAAAEAEASLFDPGVQAVRAPPRTPYSEPGTDTPIVYNPTAPHLAEADRQREHARTHEQAARTLEGFEHRECGATPAAQRAACPLLTPWVQALEETPRGAVLWLKTGTDGGALASRMKCHLAFARARGFPEDASCPLYFRGVTVELDPAGDRILIRAETPDAVQRLHREIRLLFGPATRAQR